MTNTQSDTLPVSPQQEADAVATLFRRYLADGAFTVCAEVPPGSGSRIAITVGPEHDITTDRAAPIGVGEVRWPKCGCKVGPLASETALDSNLIERCPRCNVALGGDPKPFYRVKAVAEPETTTDRAGDAGLVERAARAICRSRDLNPDALYQHNFEGDWPEDERRDYTDPFTGEPRVQLFHRAWRRWVKAAEAALSTRTNKGEA